MVTSQHEAMHRIFRHDARTFARAFHALDLPFYAELVELGLGRTRGARIWRKLMSVDLSFFRSETSQRMREEARAEGREEGVSHSILRILRRRGIDVSSAAEDKIVSCHDRVQLGEWLDRAIGAQSVDDVFSD
ncbi:hypothetical protein ACSVDM_16600 [Nocardia sp. JW2]|uniref:hypothetical protein n=1 Tax=Nocardia sp. JW2 TaxID=3450738 RepID=UPI003F4206F7